MPKFIMSSRRVAVLRVLAGDGADVNGLAHCDIANACGPVRDPTGWAHASLSRLVDAGYAIVTAKGSKGGGNLRRWRITGAGRAALSAAEESIRNDPTAGREYSCKWASARRHYDRHKRPRLAKARKEKAQRWAASVSTDDVNWFAGHFEGEGTITLGTTGKNGGYKPSVSLSSTDYETIGLFSAKWPASIPAPRRPTPKAKLVWTWRITGAVRIVHFIDTMYPALRTKRVRDKFDVVGEYCRKMVAEQYNREGDKSWKRPLAEKIKALNRRGRPPPTAEASAA